MRTRKTIAPDLKFRLALEALRENKNDSELSREHNVHAQLIGQWKRQLLKQGSGLFIAKKQEKQKNKKTEELENIIGRQAIEIQFLKKVLGQLD